MPNQSDKSNSHAIAHRFRGFLPVVVDVETAGFNCRTDALLEIAAVIIGAKSDGDLYPKETIHCNVEPFKGANMEQSALDFTGIDPNSPFRNAQPEKLALDKIFTPIRKEIKAAGCTRAILVGHNASFDHGFVFAAAERTGIKRNPFHPFSSFDTTTLAALAYGQTVLAKACSLAGISFDGNAAHSAKYDTEKTAELFCKIVNKWRHFGGWPL
ncbi:MAG: ribonuclease T [Oleiphilaceae bacterium]|nr:ribonuclease T [Oleiphilaceae bacterium]